MKQLCLSSLLLVLLWLGVGCAPADYSYAKTEASYASSPAYGYAGGAPAPSAPMTESMVREEAYYDADESGGDALGMLSDPYPAPKIAEQKPADPPKDGVAPQGGDKTPGSEPTVQPEVPKQRLVIYQAQLGLFVFKIEESWEKAKAISDKYKGWIQQSTNTSLTIRVPAAEFEKAMEELSKLGDIQYKNVTGTDVTEEFYDSQIRLKNAQELRNRFVELLKSARNVEDSLAIERELARVTEEIELLKGRLKFLGDQIAFSTVTVNFSLKTQEPVTYSRIPLPFGWMGEYNLDSILR
jgi:hypothetical protein